MAAKLNVPLTGLASLIDARDAISANYLKVEKIAAPYTVVQNRALMPDLSKDLGVRIGTQRIMTQGLVEATDESTATGARVWKVLGDAFDQIRFIGDVQALNDNEGARIRFATPNTLDKIEITFYGTGLNVLHKMTTGTSTVDYAVDGTPTGSLEFLGAVLTSNFFYDSNIIKNVVSGLTLGTHTVTISNKTGWSGNPDFYGFEILTESSTLRINPGTVYGEGSAYNLQSSQSVSYNTGFESGTLGTKGGNVIVYLKEDGTIGKSVIPTDTTTKYFTNADHTNEELIKHYSWYDFNTNRIDDWGNLLSTTSNRAYTLDDGVTQLASANCSTFRDNGINGFYCNGVNSYFYFNFIGTGLDMLAFRSAACPDNFQIYLDAGSLGEITSGQTSSGVIFNLTSAGTKWTKIVSGLPYGTHSIAIVRRVVASNSPIFSDFKVYGPKTPTLPSKAKLLSQYYLTGNYQQLASVPGYAEPGLCSPSGVIRHVNMREFFYSGTWNAPSVGTGACPSGFAVGATSVGAYCEFTFFGTGIDFHSQTNASALNFSVTIDGVSNLSSYTTAFLSSTTGMTWTASTGTLGGTTAAISRYMLKISGLPLGKHTFRITRNSGDTMYVDVIDVHTPIHSYQMNPARYDMLLGNSSIKREIYPEDKRDLFFRNPSLHVNLASGQLLNSGSATIMLWDTTVNDNFRGYNKYSGKYFIKKEGTLRMSSSILPASTTTWTAGNDFAIYLYVSDVETKQSFFTVQAAITDYIGIPILSVDGLLVKEGDFLYIKGYQNSGDNVNTQSSGSLNFWGLTILPESEEE